MNNNLSTPNGRLLVFFVLICFFRPTILEKYDITNNITNLILTVSLILTAFDAIAKHCLPSKKIFLLVFVYYSVSLYSTIINGGSVSRSLTYILPGLLTVIFVKYMMRYELEYASKIMRKLLWLYVAINIVTIILFPNGISQVGNQLKPVWFLGQETRFAYFYLPALLFCFMDDYLYANAVRKKTIYIYLICLLSLIMAWTVGSSLAMLFLVFFLLFNRLPIFNSKIYFISQIVAYFGLVYFEIQMYFEAFIVGYLHKDATLSSRTLIWHQALAVIEENPYFGIGIYENKYMIDILGFVHCHNHLLHVTLQSGHIGLILFLIIIIAGYMNLKKFGDFLPARFLAAFIFIIGIQLLADSIDGVRNHYLFIICMAIFFDEYKRKFKSL